MTACSCYRFFTCTACTAVSMLTPKRSHTSAMRNASIPPWWVPKWRRTSPNVVDGVPRSIQSPVPHNLLILIKCVGKTTHKTNLLWKEKLLSPMIQSHVTVTLQFFCGIRLSALESFVAIFIQKITRLEQGQWVLLYIRWTVTAAAMLMAITSKRRKTKNSHLFFCRHKQKHKLSFGSRNYNAK